MARGGWELGRVGQGQHPTQALPPPHSKFPQTATEWAEILALQKQFHSVEVHKWRQILRASVELLDEVWLWGCGALCSDPNVWQRHLGLSFFLCILGKSFIVLSSQGCRKKWNRELAHSRGRMSTVSDFRHGLLQPPSCRLLTAHRQGWLCLGHPPLPPLTKVAAAAPG